MADSWIKKEDATIRDDIVRIAKEETGLTNFKSTGVLRALVEVLYRVVLFIYQTAINPIYDNASLDNATGIFLSLWGLMLGVVRKKEEKTKGRFTATAYGNGQVPAGAWIVVDGTDLRYRVTEEVAFSSGQTFAIPVLAEYPGGHYNIGAGTPLRITRVIAGLDTVTVGSDWISATGQDVEQDDPYRERIKTRWRSQTLGDTKNTYRFCAEEVSGVKSARIVRAPRGPGSTDVIIAAVNGLPGNDLLESVRVALHDHELLAFDVQVKAPQATSVTVVVEFSGTSEEADVMLVVEKYVQDLGIGGRFSLHEVYARLEPLKLKTVEITSPARDVQAADSAIIVATITVTKVGT